MSTETPLGGAELAALVADGTLTREHAESSLAKMAFAVKRKLYVSVFLYTFEDKSTVKIYPLDKKQAEHLNHDAGETLHIPAVDWKSAYDTSPLPEE